MELGRYSLGIGDRFGMEGGAQLRALQLADARGVSITPVWNKSNREHSLIGTTPADARRAADAAVNARGWSAPYFVDADHIGLATAEKFLDSCDFFTIDVADAIGSPPPQDTLSRVVKGLEPLKGSLTIPGIDGPLKIDDAFLQRVARTYGLAVQEAGRVYRFIRDRKGRDFIPEVSFDETNTPQTPAELLLILAAVAKEGIPVQTIAPKFSGSFLKGVDYVGDVSRFEKEFRDDLAVVAYAQKEFNLPPGLKLSVHSGSDKFSLYPVMHRALKDFNAGLHLKTAGTTWLEEVIGLASAGGDGLAFARLVYAEAVRRFDELAKPYATVIHVDRNALPDPRVVSQWSSAEFAGALAHDQGSPRFNSQVRQLVHIAFRVAAERGDEFRRLLTAHRDVIEANVTANLFDRHIAPLFLGDAQKGGRKASRMESAATT